MEADSGVLTEQEAAVYDRQIRVWGVDAQKRLSKSRILVDGMTGVVAEMCKNIVLAGVGSLTLIDDGMEIKDMVGAHFLTPVDQIESRRSSVAALWMESLKDFNPMVHVAVEEGNLVDRPEDFFDNFDAVVVGRSSLGLRKQINAICRKRPHRIAFYTVDCRGTVGEIFVDLQKHSYTPQKKGTDATVVQEMQFCSFAEALSICWISLPKRMTKLFFAMRIIEEFEQVTGQTPGQISSKHLEAILTLQKKICEAQGVAESLVPEKLLKRILDGGSRELPPVCAIIGGILGQEVIKAMSCKGEPLKNFFFYDALDGKGIIEDVGMPNSQ
eukprot:c15063_g1_i1 orf=39-1022(+)